MTVGLPSSKIILNLRVSIYLTATTNTKDILNDLENISTFDDDDVEGYSRNWERQELRVYISHEFNWILEKMK